MGLQSDGFGDMVDSLRPTEMAVMVLLEQVIVEAQQAQRRVQDDGLVTNEDDRRVIKDHLMKIRAVAMQIDKELGSQVMSVPPRSVRPNPRKTLPNFGSYGSKKR